MDRGSPTTADPPVCLSIPPSTCLWETGASCWITVLPSAALTISNRARFMVKCATDSTSENDGQSTSRCGDGDAEDPKAYPSAIAWAALRFSSPEPWQIGWSAKPAASALTNKPPSLSIRRDRSRHRQRHRLLSWVPPSPWKSEVRLCASQRVPRSIFPVGQGDYSMPRHQLFEIHDSSKCPKVIRNGLTDFLQTSTDLLDTYEPIRARLLAAIASSGSNTVVDLCSGAGGPWVKWNRKNLVNAIPVTLTDRFPTAFPIPLSAPVISAVLPLRRPSPP